MYNHPHPRMAFLWIPKAVSLVYTKDGDPMDDLHLSRLQCWNPDRLTTSYSGLELGVMEPRRK